MATHTDQLISGRLPRGRAAADDQARSMLQPLRERALQRDSRYRRALAVSDATATLIACGVAVQTSSGTSLRWTTSATPIVLVAAAKLIGLYDHDSLALRRSTLDEVPVTFSVATLFAFVFWLAGGLFVNGDLTRGRVLSLWLVLWLGLLVGRALARTGIRFLWPADRCMLIGSYDVWHKLKLSMSLRHGLDLVAYFPMRSRAGGRFTPLGRSLVLASKRLREASDRHDVDRVVIALSGVDEFDENMIEGIFALEQLGLKVSVVPHMLEVIGSAGQFEDLDGLPVLGVRPVRLSRSSRIIKRVFDLGVGGAVLAVAAPFMAAIAVAVWLSTHGPILFRQPRVGYQGQVFEMLKFRTMYTGADELRAELLERNETDGVFKLADDPRVTPIGRLLRRTSMDELPQLFNVLRGDMSLVGPRPLVPAEDSQVHGWRRLRLELEPGMTGPWQVLGSTRVPLAEMVKIDYLYIANWSPWRDIRALLLTLPHVLGRKGL